MKAFSTAALFVVVAGSAGAQQFALAPGSTTSCGAGYGLYEVRLDVAVTQNSPLEEKQLRWGPSYGVPGPARSACQFSEADGALAVMWEQTHGYPAGTATWQDAQDMGLVDGLDRQIELEHCSLVGPCDPARAVRLVDDDDAWTTGRAPRGGHPLACPTARADQSGCGLQESWNCFWRHSEWVYNAAPHCRIAQHFSPAIP